MAKTKAKIKAKTKDQILVMLRGVEQRRHSFLNELGEEYVPIVILDQLKGVAKTDLLKLGEQAIKDASALAARVIKRREETEVVIDEVNQLNSSLGGERAQPTRPPMSLKAPLNERALGVEVHDAKQMITHLQQENAILQGQVALLHGIVEQGFALLGTSMSEEQKKQCADTLLTLVEKMASK